LTARGASHGRYEEAELDQILARLDLDAIWFPAVTPETYSYTLTAALKQGLHLVAFDMGALGERIRESGHGTLLDAALMLDPTAIARELRNIGTGRRHRPLRFTSGPYENPVADYYDLGKVLNQPSQGREEQRPHTPGARRVKAERDASGKGPEALQPSHRVGSRVPHVEGAGPHRRLIRY